MTAVSSKQQLTQRKQQLNEVDVTIETQMKLCNL